MAKSRITILVDDATRVAAEKAAALLGMKSLDEYILRLIEKDARRVIREHESIVLRDDVFDCFMSVCEATEGPNQTLREAGDYSKERGIR